MTCQACFTRDKPEHFGSELRCAFEKGPFDGDNWQCETANSIRDVAAREGDNRIHHIREENQNYATISLLGFDVLVERDEKGFMNAQPTCLWVGWYKQRGRTEGMYLMFENLPPRPPTEAECLKIYEFYTKGEQTCH